jgi:DNA-binding transcriptional MerR regulator
MEFNKNQISERSGLTLRQVQFYTEEGLVAPEGMGEGRGKFRKYSFGNLFDFLVIKELVNHGVTIKKIESILEVIRKDDFYMILPKMFKSYKKLRCYIKIFLNNEGMIVNLVRSSKAHEEDKLSILDTKDLDNFSSVIIINLRYLIEKAVEG